MSKRVLCVLADGFEEIETVTPVDLLRRAEVEVVMATIGGSLQVTGRCGIRIEVDALLADVDAGSFDLLLIPGGPGVSALREDGRAAAMATSFVASEKPVAAICAAPMVLADAGLLEGKHFAAHSSVHEALPAGLTDERVVEDGLIITSNGAGTALDFGLWLVQRMAGRTKAVEVAQAIMA